ncbi:PPOX class F420-dependent oxidoreductase [Nocardioides sp.]|uniref:PPOX class F420-dependent oxidoreductase n=1 Tax=Nocardioides sp. TaxID=35761 RepID=UPI00356AEE01
MTSWRPGWEALPEPLASFWAERHLCTLTTLRADGRPHVVPVGAPLDLEQRCAWIITNGSSAKAGHLRTRGPVAICQVDGARWATIEGTGLVTEDPLDVARAVERYAARYRQPRVNPARVAIRVSVERILCSASLLG